MLVIEGEAMPNETIVQYILNVDTGKAEKGLKDTSMEAKQTATQFERTAQSSKVLTSGLKRTERQAATTEKRFRQMRRAGRDLDGAFADLAQGIGLINPALGNMFMTLSDGASVAEGLGRVMTLFVNPAFVVAGLVTTAATAAYFVFQKEQKRAADQAKILAQATKQVTAALENQDKILNQRGKAFEGFISNINLATARLAVLEGKLSESDFEDLRISQKVQSEAQAVKDNLDLIISQLEKSSTDTKKEIDLLNKELDKTGKREERKPLAEKKQALEAIIKQNDFEIVQLKDKKEDIDLQINGYEQILQKIQNITEEQKDQAERERKRTQALNTANKKLAEQQSARNKLAEIGARAALDLLSAEERIEKEYQDQLARARSLAVTAEDFALLAEVELNLLDQKNEKLDDLNNKEKDRLDLMRQQVEEVEKILRIAGSSIQLLSDPSSFVSGLGGVLSMAGVGAGSAVSAGGSAVSSIASLGSAIGDAIDEAAQEGITLDEKQAERVVLGNMNKAFTSFLSDLDRGMRLLPELLVQILPDFIVSLFKVLTVDMQRLIAIDLPVALIRSIPELVIAIINEVGFLIADLVNGFKQALDQFRSFLDSLFTREGRQEAISSSIDNLKDFFKNEFGGITAAKEAVQGFAGGGSFIPHAAGGMRFTGASRSGLAMLHQNEFVVPASGQRPQSVDRQMSNMGGGLNIVINSPVVEQNAVDALVRRIEERFNSNFGLSSSDLFGGR